MLYIRVPREPARGTSRDVKEKPVRSFRSAVVSLLASTLALAACSSADPSTTASSSGSTPSAALATLVPAAARAKGKLVFVEAAAAPLAYIEPGKSEVVGVIPDLVRDATARLGLDVQFQKVDLDGAVPGLLAKRYDAIAPIGDFKARHDVVDLIDLLHGGTALMVAKGNPTGVKGLDDLCGRKLAVVRGGIAERSSQAATKTCTDSGKPAIQVSSVPDSQALVLALQSGRVEVVWNDRAAIGYLMKQQKGAFEVPAGVQESAPYAIALPKDATGLRDALQAAVQASVDDGSYGKILDKWGVTDIGLSKITVNDTAF